VKEAITKKQSLLDLLFDSDDEASTFLRNVVQLVPDYTASHVRTCDSSYSPLPELRILYRPVIRLKVCHVRQEVEYRKQRKTFCAFNENLPMKLCDSYSVDQCVHKVAMKDNSNVQSKARISIGNFAREYDKSGFVLASPSAVRMIRSRRMRRAGHVAHTLRSGMHIGF
jgi:hypothetical protein